MDLGVIITALIGIATSFISSWITWFFTRQKYNAEVDHSLIENLKESLDFYRQLSDDNTKRLEQSLERGASLEKEVSELRKQVTTMMSLLCTDLTCKMRRSKYLGEI